MLTTLWLQKDLNFLGYNAGVEDGVLGKNTRKAVQSFQKDFGLDVDGIAGNDTCNRLVRVIKECQSILGTSQDGLAGYNTKTAYSNFDGIKYFKYKEFTCHCGCGYNTIDIRLVKILDDIRKHYGKDMYIYSDTDSIHTQLPIEECKKFCQIDDYKLGYWAHEGTAQKGKFVRQKCYIEEIDGKIKITCAGLPENCYDQVTWDNFKEGFTAHGKLTYKYVKGGVKLVETDFTIKEE